YYIATLLLSLHLGVSFEVYLPVEAAYYQKAFKAGTAFPYDDFGPFLGRALLWKMQLELHADKKDVGPSISFPTGRFSKGHLIIPELGAKLRYGPGSFVIFWSSRLLHTLGPRWQPTNDPVREAQGITPGRAAHVFFFPLSSMKQLEDKEEFWGVRTGYGRSLKSSYYGAV
ncbi:hypothetical protein BDN71DRAFT_1358125, partial [Pleurotus eryngii]